MIGICKILGIEVAAPFKGTGTASATLILAELIDYLKGQAVVGSAVFPESTTSWWLNG